MSDKPMESMPPIRPEKKPDEDDARAKQEVEALESQALGADRQRKEHARQEKLRNVFAFCVRVLLALIFFLVATALVCVAWHYLMPESRHWMPEGALKTVSTVLFSGTLFVFLGLYVRDRV